MKTKLLNRWYALRTSFWLVPALMVMMAIVLALGMVILDERVNGWVKGLGWVYARGPEGARAILETIASSMITVAGVVFSIPSSPCSSPPPNSVRAFCTTSGAIPSIRSCWAPSLPPLSTAC